MQTDKPILEQISTIRNLPTLPNILVKLIRACNKNEIYLQEVSNQALTLFSEEKLFDIGPMDINAVLSYMVKVIRESLSKGEERHHLQDRLAHCRIQQLICGIAILYEVFTHLNFEVRTIGERRCPPKSKSLQ